jgi:hypothetical protein
VKTFFYAALVILAGLCCWGVFACSNAGSAGKGGPAVAVDYPIVDSNQSLCYNASAVIACPASGMPFYGQDAQIEGNQPSYRDNGDGTVTDLRTGLMWVKARGSQVTLSDAVSGAAACNVGGHADWRMPTVKELYSLIEFSGAAGQSMTSTAGYTPFLDAAVFGFAYGPGTGTAEGERVIDCQDWSSTAYVSKTMNDAPTQFGVNFADGHLKGYPIYQPPTNSVPETHYVRYVRGNANYGVNRFQDNGAGVIADNATGLMWSQNDSAVGMDWQDALAWAQTQNAANYLGRNDWRLPNVKELQSIVDYSRSPDATGSAAIDPAFHCTQIANEGGEADYPYYWTGTTLDDGSPSLSGVYIAFGRALGWMQAGSQTYYSLLDVHGAGAQRSDPKSGSLSSYQLGVNASGKPVYGRGPQGDVVRIDNFVRLVRGGAAGPAPADDDDDNDDNDDTTPPPDDDSGPPPDDDDNTPPPDDDVSPPPQQAVAACEGKAIGAACEFTGLGGQIINGTCQMVGDVLACVPSGPPDR